MFLTSDPNGFFADDFPWPGPTLRASCQISAVYA